MGRIGKRMVEGPEAKQGRRDLTETIQAQSNPYTDGRALGDSWLTSAEEGKAEILLKE